MFDAEKRRGIIPRVYFFWAGVIELYEKKVKQIKDCIKDENKTKRAGAPKSVLKAKEEKTKAAMKLLKRFLAKYKDLDLSNDDILLVPRIIGDCHWGVLAFFLKEKVRQLHKWPTSAFIILAALHTY